MFPSLDSTFSKSNKTFMGSVPCTHTYTHIHTLSTTNTIKIGCTWQRFSLFPFMRIKLKIESLNLYDLLRAFYTFQSRVKLLHPKNVKKVLIIWRHGYKHTPCVLRECDFSNKLQGDLFCNRLSQSSIVFVLLKQ